MTPGDARMLLRNNARANKSIFDAVAALPEAKANQERNPGERNSNISNL